MTTNAVAVADRAEGSIQDLVRSNWAAIKGSLPASMDEKRFARLVFNAVRKTPRLAEATATSLIGSLLASASLGLEVDTPLGECYLVPYRRKDRSGRQWVEAQLIVGYQGIVKLYRQHPAASRVASGWVGARDEFAYAYGTDPHLSHTPALGDRGEPIAYWASYTLKDGTSDFVVLSPEEVRTLRSKGEDEKRDVADPQHWMERKTALKQVLKLAPKATHLATALIVDEQPIAQAARDAGITVTRLHIDEPNLSTVAGEIEAAPEPDAVPGNVDPQTGEIAQEPLSRATRSKINAAFKSLGVESGEVDSYLSAFGIPCPLAELSEDQGVELLGAAWGTTREGLAQLLRDANGS